MSGTPGDVRPDSAVIATGLRIFSNIAEQWRLTPAQRTRLLGLADLQELVCLFADAGARDADRCLDRISHVMAIWRALHMLFNVPAQANGWIARPNSHPIFGGSAAIDLMTTGRIEDLALVRQYLESQSGGHF